MQPGGRARRDCAAAPPSLPARPTGRTAPRRLHGRAGAPVGLYGGSPASARHGRGRQGVAHGRCAVRARRVGAPAAPARARDVAANGPHTGGPRRGRRRAALHPEIRRGPRRDGPHGRRARARQAVPQALRRGRRRVGPVCRLGQVGVLRERPFVRPRGPARLGGGRPVRRPRHCGRPRGRAGGGNALVGPRRGRPRQGSLKRRPAGCAAWCAAGGPAGGAGSWAACSRA